MVYSVKVKSRMNIDKHGNTTLDDLDVRADGYRNRELLNKAMESFNNGKSLPSVKRDYKNDGWKYSLWSELFEDMIYILSGKKRKRHRVF